MQMEGACHAHISAHRSNLGELRLWLSTVSVPLCRTSEMSIGLPSLLSNQRPFTGAEGTKLNQWASGNLIRTAHRLRSRSSVGFSDWHNKALAFSRAWRW
jgi:hypothetical protein